MSDLRSGTVEDAAELLERRWEEIHIILRELEESAALVGQLWTAARKDVRENPELALERLTEAEIQLDNHARLEISDSLRAIRSVIKRLDAALPDDPP